MSNMYKDSLFRSLFSEKQAFLSLYNALSGSDYGPDTEVDINTLADTLFTSRKNDVSGIIDGKLIAITEHQSTVNENMPFRFLSHIARLLENTVTDKAAVYRRKLVKMPRPEFYVVLKSPVSYGGPDILRLSDAFASAKGTDETGLELIVKIVNIDDGRNEEVLRRCGPLKGFSEYIDAVIRIQERIAAENPGMNRDTVRQTAIAQAVTYCKAHGILAEFFEKLLPEEVNMLATEWKLEDALVVEREEALEEGLEKGREEGFEEGREETRQEDIKLFSNLMSRAKSMDELKRMFETSFSQ